MSNKAKLSNIVQRQFPEHIRENYPLLVEFVKLYYEFMQESQVVELEKIRDIDTSLDEFIDSFKSELAKNVPLNNVSDKRLLLKNIRDFYLSRGSEESYKFLFRTLFEKEAELFYPSTQILRVSDGKWKQDVSIFLKVTGTTQNLFPLEGNFITITTSSKVITTYVSNVAEYTNDTFEVFIEREYQNNITVGSIASVTIDSVTYTGVVLPCPSKVSIYQPGSGFKVGDIFSLKTALGRGCTIKVTKIDSNGGIKAIQLVKFGLDYVSTFYSYLSSVQDIAYEYVHPAKLNHPTGTWSPAYTDPLDNTANYGYASRQIYFYDDTNIPIASSSYSSDRLYADGSYVGEVIGSFYDESDNSIKEDLAIIQVDLGAVAKYPGYYSTSDGFISDEMYIHDGEYYQAFSYVIKVEEELRKYADIVKALIHPAGMKLFAEYNITNIINVAARSVLIQSVLQLPTDGADTFGVSDRGESYSSYTTTYSQILQDWVVSPEAGASIVYSSQGAAALFFKKIASSVASALTTEITKHFYKQPTSTQTLGELIEKEFIKNLSHTISTIATQAIAKEITKIESSNVASTSGISSKILEKFVSSGQVIGDEVAKEAIKNVSSSLISVLSEAILNAILNKTSPLTTPTSGISYKDITLNKNNSAAPSDSNGIQLNPILDKSSPFATPTSGITSKGISLGRDSPVTHDSGISSMSSIKGIDDGITLGSTIAFILPVLRFGPFSFTATDGTPTLTPSKEFTASVSAQVTDIIKESIINASDNVLFSDIDFVRNVLKGLTETINLENSEDIAKSFVLGTVNDNITVGSLASLTRAIIASGSFSASDINGFINTLAKNIDDPQEFVDSSFKGITPNFSDTAFAQGSNIYDVNGNATVVSMIKSSIKPLTDTVLSPVFDTTPATRVDNVTFFSDIGSNLIALDGNSTQNFTGYGLYVPRRLYTTGVNSTPLGALNTPTWTNGNTITNFQGQTVVVDYIASQVIENIVTAYKPKSATYTVSMTSSRTTAPVPLISGSSQYYQHPTDSFGTRTFTFANSSDVTNLNAVVGDYLWCSGFTGGDLVSSPPETSLDETAYYYILNGYGWKITAIDAVAKTVTCSALFTFDRTNSNLPIGTAPSNGQVYRMTSLQLQTNALDRGRGNTFDGSYGLASGIPLFTETWTQIDYMTLMPVLSSDKLSNTLSKPFSSGATSNDSNTLTYSSNTSDPIFAQSGSIVMNPAKGLTETINITMAGAIVANPYAAEEYGVATDLLSPGSLLD
jgi:hypothetical protein